MVSEEDQAFEIDNSQTVPEHLLSKLCSFDSLISKFNAIPKKSKLLKRITKELKKTKSDFSKDAVLFFTKENHEYSTLNDSIENEYDFDSGNFKQLESQSEENILEKLISRVNKELLKFEKKSQNSNSEKSKTEDKNESQIDQKAKMQSKMQWDMFYWWNLHGPNWLQDQNYLHSLVSYYKINPLNALMSDPNKEYTINEQNMGRFIWMN
jgi:hypothetical protein